jgi:hypothetical protein
MAPKCLPEKPRECVDLATHRPPKTLIRAIPLRRGPREAWEIEVAGCARDAARDETTYFSVDPLFLYHYGPRQDRFGEGVAANYH